MKLQKTSKLLTPVLGALALGICSANAAVSTLTFSNGTGTGSFDQYTGTAGSGWAGAWGTNIWNSGSFAAAGGSATVINTTPINGGGNYLSVTGVNAAAGSITYGVNRQWSSAGFDFSSGVQFEFDLRVLNIQISGSNQQIGIRASNVAENVAATAAPSGNTSWALASSGSGWSVWNGTAFTDLKLNGTGGGTGVISANSNWHFTITTTAADTYTASVFNLASPGNVYSFSGLTLGNKSDAGLTVLNFLDNVTTGKTGGFAIDNISVTSLASPVPEPSSFALIAGAAGLGFGALRRRRRA